MIGSDRLAAPSLLPYELASVGRKKLRQGLLTAEQVRMGLDDFAATDVELHDVPAAAILECAERLGLSAYDASYVWLARELGADLLTLDAKLARAAGVLKADER